MRKDDPLVGQILHERYRVLRRIGKGGMGVVYLAEHVLLQKRVALKVLSIDAIGSHEHAERFLREARAAAAVGNEHVVDVTDMGLLDSGLMYFALEYLDGVDLAYRVAADGPLEVHEALDLLIQLCDALEAVHAQGIVHRDLKPENLFVVRRNNKDFLKVLDFGVCKMRQPEPSSENLTITGTTVGTPSYMSPEQVHGAKSVDHRIDVYAIGAVGYFLLAGAPPFDSPTLPTLFMNICNVEAVPLERRRVGVPAAVSEAIMRALAKEPEERFQSCAFLREALLFARATAPTEHLPPQPSRGHSSRSELRFRTARSLSWGSFHASPSVRSSAGERSRDESLGRARRATAVIVSALALFAVFAATRGPTPSSLAAEGTGAQRDVEPGPTHQPIPLFRVLSSSLAPPSATRAKVVTAERVSPRAAFVSNHRVASKTRPRGAAQRETTALEHVEGPTDERTGVPLVGVTTSVDAVSALDTPEIEAKRLRHETLAPARAAESQWQESRPYQPSARGLRDVFE